MRKTLLVLMGLLMSVGAVAQTASVTGAYQLVSKSNGKVVSGGSALASLQACVDLARTRNVTTEYWCRVTVSAQARTTTTPPPTCTVTWSAWVEVSHTVSGSTVTITEQRTGTVTNEPAGCVAPTTSLTETRTRTESTLTGWTFAAFEGGSFTVYAPANVRYGANGTYLQTTREAGTHACSNSAFGSDPLVGVSKVCEVTPATTLEAPPPPPPPTGGNNMGMGLPVNLALVPAPATGYSTLRRQAGPARGQPYGPTLAGDGVGAFRIPCEYSHFAFDDPIVYPNQPGAAHLHVFFGNTGANANSTAQSLATTGNSTCAGGIANRSSYWVPAMLDTATGAPQRPNNTLWYYKSGYNVPRASMIQDIPNGLKILTGKKMTDTGPYPQWENKPGIHFRCVINGAEGPATEHIPNCPGGSQLQSHMIFPQCWDGVNLDSPDHRSHMAYPEGSSCPTTHPVWLPQLALNIYYNVPAGGSTANWRLASDVYDRSIPGGYTMHGDVIFAWDQAVKSTWVKWCVQDGYDCHGYLLGDGTELY